MRKFLRWFMKLFNTDSSGFVKNIQTDSDKGQKGGSVKTVSKGKKTVHEKDQIFWIPTNKIIEIKKNGQGFTTNINLASGSEFLSVNYKGKFVQVSKKQGLSKVSHHLEFTLAEVDKLREERDEILARNTNITILHIDRVGDGFLYGEARGLAVIEFENGRLVLEGSEDNVFYEMTQECLQRAVPNKE